MFAWIQSPARPITPLPGVRSRVAGLLDHDDEETPGALPGLYREYIAATPGSTRAGDLQWLSDEVAAGRAPAATLEAALAGEPSVDVAVEAALGIAAAEPDGGDRLVRIAEGEDTASPGGALGGLLFCGDPRAVPVAVLAMARLPEGQVRTLAGMDASRLLMAQVEIWIRLAERWAGDGDVRAALALDALARVARRHRGGAAVAYESLGESKGLARGPGRAPSVVAEMTFERFAARVRPRIEAIGGDADLWAA